MVVVVVVVLVVCACTLLRWDREVGGCWVALRCIISANIAVNKPLCCCSCVVFPHCMHRASALLASRALASLQLVRLCSWVDLSMHGGLMLCDVICCACLCNSAKGHHQSAYMTLDAGTAQSSQACSHTCLLLPFPHTFSNHLHSPHSQPTYYPGKWASAVWSLWVCSCLATKTTQVRSL